MTDVTTPSQPRDIGGAITAAHDAAERYQKPTLIHIDHPADGRVTVPALLCHAGLAAVPKGIFAEYLEHPERRKGTAVMTRLESFIEHVLRFKNADSVIFAKDDRAAPGLIAVLDYHDAGATGTPRFGQHRTTFNFPVSDEWKVWNKRDGTRMSMVEFADFLEERINDIDLVESADDLNEDIQRFIGATGLDKIASPSRLVELSRNLQIHEASTVKSAHNPASGEGVIRFESEHTDAAGQPVDVPGLFVICIPVFAHDGYYRIAARLRYRKGPDGISFWYDLWRADLVFDHAFDQACERVKTQTSLPLLIGAPE